jgi:hypothetical protein
MARSSLTHALALAGLLLLIPTQAPAASSPEVFGEWIVSNDNGVNLAFATSDGGQSLMLRCDGNGCMWMLVTKNPCTPGVRTNMLFSPSAPTVGNLALKAECLDRILSSGYYRLALMPYDDLTDALDKLLRNTQAGDIGFVFPVAGGQFYVARFPLSGMQRAMARLQALNEKSFPAAPAGRTGTKDQVL